VLFCATSFVFSPTIRTFELVRFSIRFTTTLRLRPRLFLHAACTPRFRAPALGVLCSVRLAGTAM
jgi:hypothetical protein